MRLSVLNIGSSLLVNGGHCANVHFAKIPFLLLLEKVKNWKWEREPELHVLNDNISSFEVLVNGKRHITTKRGVIKHNMNIRFVVI